MQQLKSRNTSRREEVHITGKRLVKFCDTSAVVEQGFFRRRGATCQLLFGPLDWKRKSGKFDIIVSTVALETEDAAARVNIIEPDNTSEM